MAASSLRPILLVEDNPRDLELTLAALERCQLANEIIVARDGAEALDYLHARGPFQDRAAGERELEAVRPQGLVRRPPGQLVQLPVQGGGLLLQP